MIRFKISTIQLSASLADTQKKQQLLPTDTVFLPLRQQRNKNKDKNLPLTFELFVELFGSQGGGGDFVSQMHVFFVLFPEDAQIFRVLIGRHDLLEFLQIIVFF